MKYLIDTHILIWIAISPEKISPSILSLMENPNNQLCISSVSLWEIAIKLSIGKLDLNGLEIADLVQICNEQNIEIVELPISAVIQYKKLPIKENHKDPFDRALISLCISNDMIFLSMDTKLEQYKTDGLVFIS